MNEPSLPVAALASWDRLFHDLPFFDKLNIMRKKNVQIIRPQPP
jgi:hypothetical protein